MSNALSTLRDFLSLYRTYRTVGHPRKYAVRVAYEIAILGLPF